MRAVPDGVVVVVSPGAPVQVWEAVVVHVAVLVAALQAGRAQPVEALQYQPVDGAVIPLVLAVEMHLMVTGGLLDGVL